MALIALYCVITVLFIVPSAPVLNESPTVTTTSITITGSVPAGSVVTSFHVEWQRDTLIACSSVEDHGSITNNSNSFTRHKIDGLQPGNRYTINVTVFNGAGSAVSNSVTATTMETGEREIPVSIPVFTVSLYSSL